MNTAPQGSGGRGDTVRVGVIGCGHWGRHYVRLFGALPGSAVAALADPDPGRRDAALRQAPGARAFASHDELFAAGACDAVAIATPASTHYSLTRRALDLGLDVLAEKPLALSVAEAADLAGTAARLGRQLMVAHTFLFNPGIREVRRLIGEGVLGDIYYIKARRTHLGLMRQDVNALWDLAPHDVAILLHLLREKPAAVQAMGRKMLRTDRHDVAFVNLAFPSGIVAHIHVSWADSNKERYLDVVGSRARVVFDDLSVSEPVRVFHKGIIAQAEENANFGEFKYLLRDGDIVSPRIPAQEPLRILCEEFLDAVRTRRNGASDGAFGRDVVEVLERIQAALDRSPETSP